MRNGKVTTALLLSKPDIAALAKVQRPVVTTWIKRYRSSAHPFPSPVAADGRRDQFRAVDVVDWLRARGLGNSDTLAEDLALHASLDHPSSIGADAIFHGTTALLCLKVTLGEQLSDLDPEDLLDAADDVDADDGYLYRELVALGDDIVELAAHVDRMADAAYTPAQAFEALMAQRFRRGLRDLAESTVRPAAVDLAARVCAAVTTDDQAVFVDPSPDGSDLLVALRSALPEFADPVAMTGRGDSPSARLARRRLAVHHWQVVGPPSGGFGAEYEVDGPATFLTQFPAPGSVGQSDAEILSSVDDIAVQMRDGQGAVIIGPASALVDPLRDKEAESIRSALLRSDRVRAVVRLPEGMVVAQPGLSTAIWVLGSADPSIKPADRWTVLADLGGVELDGDVTESIVSDVLASMRSWDSLRAHAFQVGAVYKTASLLAAGTLAPPRPLPAQRPRRVAWETAGRLVQLVAEANEAAERVDPTLIVPVVYRMDASPPHTVAAGTLAKAGELKVLPGNRVDASDVVVTDEEVGAARVIGVDEVLGRCAVGDRGVDRLGFTTRNPGGRYTEPGDIVFCTSPEFGVLVDVEGSSVVVAPARIMRVADPARSGLVPQLIARHLANAGIGGRTSGAVRRGKPWQKWEIPRIAPEGVPAVTALLDDLRRRRAEAASLLASIDRVTDTLVDGVGGGVLTVAEETVLELEKG